MSPETAVAQTAVAELRGVAKTYGARGRKAAGVQAVAGVDLQLHPGRTLGLVGESGSGKSTVARLLLRLVGVTAGRVFLDGQDITELGGKRLRSLRPRMQMVFQDPFASFDPLSSMSGSVGEALRGQLPGGRRRRDGRVEELLELVGLDKAAMTRHPKELSGGQLQRVALARALAGTPDLIALDEAVSSLDVSTQAQIVNLLGDLQKRTGVAYLFISHDLSVVRHVSHDIAVMYLGKVVEAGPAGAVYANPRHPYTQALLSAVPVADPVRQRARQRIVLSGEVPSAANPPSGCRFRTRCPHAMPICAEVEPPPIATADGVTVCCHLLGAGPS